MQVKGRGLISVVTVDPIVSARLDRVAMKLAEAARRPGEPVMFGANRTAVGSLPELDLSGGWDSPQGNAEIAADFGIPT
ncbi:MAG: hypothetical protein ACM30G_07240 [Micromonosporaceae bacterium]